jgi:hypothetical protein
MKDEASYVATRASVRSKAIRCGESGNGQQTPK